MTSVLVHDVFVYGPVLCTNL